ncbi:ABC superfamily ATP binding cassette transporter [Perkinsela sp. CCAP 1560/4]|nr:ABC superfamily ATP binding cassette transporter [Perkinsela sp. CCAP 1560/4]|eukprot:KNH07310.1 ABC superfamily ATP binding cassette transporter [Perkinsela sp. CCAP 1560/4]
MAGCTCVLIGLHKLGAMRMDGVMRRVYGSYAGMVLDIHPQRIIGDITRFDNFRVGKRVRPIDTLMLLDGTDGQLASVVEGHPAFAFSDIHVAVIKGPDLCGEAEHAHAYRIPRETSSAHTVSCLFGLSKTNRLQADVVREMRRVCAPVRSPTASAPLGKAAVTEIPGRIILLDWALMPNKRLQAVQRLLLGSAFSGTKSFPKLEALARANGCVVVQSETFFLGAMSLVIAQKE